jgi:uncharacterized membrane protein
MRRWARVKVPLAAALIMVAAAVAVPTSHASQVDPSAVSVELDETELTVGPGEQFSFESTLRNTGDSQSGLIANLNIVGADPDIYVDPEDWSTERTQFLDDLPAGESTQLRWTVRAIDAGELMLYVAVSSTDADSVAVSGPLHVTVTGQRVVNPQNVVPLVMATPVAVLALLGLTLVRRRRHR